MSAKKTKAILLVDHGSVREEANVGRFTGPLAAFEGDEMPRHDPRS